MCDGVEEGREGVGCARHAPLCVVGELEGRLEDAEHKHDADPDLQRRQVIEVAADQDEPDDCDEAINGHQDAEEGDHSEELPREVPVGVHPRGVARHQHVYCVGRVTVGQQQRVEPRLVHVVLGVVGVPKLAEAVPPQ